MRNNNIGECLTDFTSLRDADFGQCAAQQTRPWEDCVEFCEQRLKVCKTVMPFNANKIVRPAKIQDNRKIVVAIRKMNAEIWQACHVVIPDSDSESASLHKLYNVTECKERFKRSESLVKLALWYGMVGRGEAIISF